MQLARYFHSISFILHGMYGTIPPVIYTAVGLMADNLYAFKKGLKTWLSDQAVLAILRYMSKYGHRKKRHHFESWHPPWGCSRRVIEMHGAFRNFLAFGLSKLEILGRSCQTKRTFQRKLKKDRLFLSQIVSQIQTFKWNIWSCRDTHLKISLKL